MDYYNYPENEPRRVPNRVVTFQIDEKKPTAVLQKCKTSGSQIDIYKLIPWVTSCAGIVLILIGVCYYIFHLVQFTSALVRYSHRNDAERLQSFWDFLFFMVTISLSCEITVVILTSIFFIVLCYTIFSCKTVKQLSETTQTMLKSMTILFVGVVVCYLQTVVGLLRLSTLVKVNQWLSEVDCECGSD